MKVWHISDTHCNQDQLVIPSGIDMVIHSGDASNYRDTCRNESELRSFIDWFAALPIPTKIFVPGNHDTSLEKGLVTRDLIEGLGIRLLINEETSVDGLRIWGSPFTPRYGDWSYMKDRGTINRIWDNIPEGLDILVTHGPPYGVLDATYDHHNKVALVGCSALRKRVTKVTPRFMLFGHVHSTDDIRNSGTRTVGGIPTVFSNGSCCDDGRMGIITSHGNVLEIEAK